MFNPIYFSDHVKPMFRKLRFIGIVSGRFLRTLFSRDRQLLLQTLDYQKKYQFQDSLLVIQYQFKNALWYCFKGIKKTTDAGIIVFNTENITVMPVTLVVFGFFTKQTFLIKVTPETKLEAAPFKTSINSFNPQTNVNPVITNYFLFKPDLPKVRLRFHSTAKPSGNIQIVYPSFNQTQFL